MTPPDLRREIDTLGPWFHNLHLPGGVETAPDHRFGDFPRFKWLNVADAVPQNLEGWTALDIGCNAGFYSIELARRGARVVGIDVEPRYLNQARWAASRCGLEEQLTFEAGDVYQLLRSERTFDLVWFTGVFYHLRYPLLSLDIVRRLTRRMMMFQTMTMPSAVLHGAKPPRDLPLPDRKQMRSAAWPKMAFIEHAVAGDETNWWAPDEQCVHAMLRSSGFRVVSQPEHEFFLCEPESDPQHRDLLQMAG